MQRHDAQKLGVVGDMLARVRLGRYRGAEPMGRAGIFAQAYRQAVEEAAPGPEDNVVLLGAHDTRPLDWISAACRSLTVLDDLSEAQMAALEGEARSRGMRNVQYKWWRTGTIPTPQGTADRIISLDFLYRSIDPATVIRDLIFTSHHGCRLVLCEPSASLDGRTARKYSREAELDMPDHQALVAYAKSAMALRRFTREGLDRLLQGSGLREVRIREALHGLALCASARVEF